MPKLTRFISAIYPPEAQKSGLAADVMLRLTIDEAGKVVEATVIEPVGNGFDDAARLAALQFDFEPARRNGIPIKVRIRYRYSFTLSPAEPRSAPAVEPPKVGELMGILRIQGTDIPLAGAEIDITGPGGYHARSATDATGQWGVHELPKARYRVAVAAPGFSPYVSLEDVVPGEATEVTYRLTASDELEVTIIGDRPSREVTRRTIERREIEHIPGTNGDALRSIEDMPGVTRPPDYSGMLIVRGSYPGDTQVFVDGSSIPLVYHFGGLRSVIPTELLERIDFYPGNFSAQYGNAMGGIVDVSLRAPDTSCKGPYGQAGDKTGCFNGIASVDLLEGRALLQGPLPIKNWTFAAGLRRSWVDALLATVAKDSGQNYRQLPVYYDWQLIAESRPTPDSKFGLRFFGNDDRLAAVVDEPLGNEPAFGGNLQYSQANWTIQGLYEGRFSRNVSSRAMVSFSRGSQVEKLGSLVSDLTYYPFQYRHSFGWSVADGLRLNAGLDFEVMPYAAQIRSPRVPTPGEAAPGPFVNQTPLSAQENGRDLREAVYAEAEILPFKRWRIVPGLRMDYSENTRKTDPNPRVNTRFDLVPGAVRPDGTLRRRTTLKAGAGIYTQPPSLEQTHRVLGTPGLASNRSEHYSVGVEQELTRQVEMSLEGFYKNFDRMVARAVDPDGPRYTTLGSGHAFGLEALLKYKPDKRFFGWLAYTLSRSVRKDFPTDLEYPIPYDRTHNLTMLGSYRLGRGWEVGARFRLMSGFPATLVARRPSLPAIQAADAGTYVILEGPRYSARLPLNHQLDIRVERSWQYQSWRLGCYVDIFNVYNNPAAEAIAYDYRYVQSSYRTGLPFLPSLGVRGEF